jgi:hypothetical protein
VNLKYNLVEVGYYDYKNLQSKAANLYYLGNKRLNDILIVPYSNILSGKYKIKGSYRLPGFNKESSYVELELLNR